MLSKTRSGKSIKLDFAVNGSKKKLVHIKGPETIRKLQGLEKGESTEKPPVKRKSDELNTLSPLRRSDRGKNGESTSFSGLQRFGEECRLSDKNVNTEKNSMQSRMGSEGVKLGAKLVGSKRNLMCARAYWNLHKKRGIRENMIDGDGSLPQSSSSLNVFSGNTSENNIHMCSKHTDNVATDPPESPHGENANDSRITSRVRETFDDSERSAINCSPVKNMEAPELESGEKHMSTEELFPAQSANCENRKRVRDSDETLDTENDGVGKKSKRVLNENVGPASVLQLELEEDQVTGSNEGPFTIVACNQSKVELGDSVEHIVSTNEHSNPHSCLKEETERLAKILQLPENVRDTAMKFLEYVIKNRRVSTDSSPYLQALQISVCWSAASIVQQKLNEKESLVLAKQHLNYRCTEEQVHLVYSKMERLSRIYLQGSEKTLASFKNNSLPEIAAAENTLKRIETECEKRMKKLNKKQRAAIDKFNRVWEEKREKLEKDHQLASAITRSIHGPGTVVTKEKLKLIDEDFAKKMEEHSLRKEIQLKDLEAKQLAAKNEEKKKANGWMKEAITYSSVLNDPVDVGPMHKQEIEDQIPINDDNVPPSRTSISAPSQTETCNAPLLNSLDEIRLVEQPNQSQHLNDVDVVGPTKQKVNCEVQLAEVNKEVAVTDVPEQLVASPDRHGLLPEQMVERTSQSTDHGDVDETVLNGQMVCDETQLVEVINKEVATSVPDSVPNGLESNNSSKESEEGEGIGLADAAMNQNIGPGVTTTGDLPSLGQSRDHGDVDKIVLDGQKVSDETQLVEVMNKEVATIVPDSLPNVLELNNSSKESDKGEGIGLPDATMNQNNGPGVTTTGDLPSPGQDLVHSGHMVASPDRHGPVQQNEVQTVEQTNRSTHPGDVDEFVLDGQKVCDENQLVDVNNEVEVMNKEVAPSVPDSVPNDLELNNSSKESDKGEGIGLADSAINQKIGHGVTATGDLPSPGQELVHSGDMIASPDRHGPVQQDEVQTVEQANRSTYPGDVDEAVLDGQKVCDETQMVEVNNEVAPGVPDSVPNDVEFNNSSKESDKGEGSGSADTVMNQKNGHGVTATGDLPSPGQELVHSGDMIASPDRHGPVQQVSQEQIHQELVPPELQEQDGTVVENPSTLQCEVSTSGQVPQEQVHINLVENRIHRLVPFVLPTHQNTSYPPVLSLPLQCDIQRLQQEVEELERSQEHTRSQRKLNLEKDIQQLRDKYEAESQESESGFTSKKNDLDKLRNRTLMNKKLADACVSKRNLDNMPSQLTAMQQVTANGHMHQLQQQFRATGSMGPFPVPPPATQPDPRTQSIHPHSHFILPSHVSTQNLTSTPPPAVQQSSPPYFTPSSQLFRVPPANQPASTTQNLTSTPPPSVQQSSTPYFTPSSRPFHAPPSTRPASTTQAMHNISHSNSMRPPHIMGQNLTSTPPRSVQNQSSLYSHPSIRPLIIGSVTGVEIRSRAPHFQSFRPPSSINTVSTTPQMPPTQPYGVLNYQPLQMPTANLGPRFIHEPHGGPQAPSATQLLMDMNSWSTRGPTNQSFSHVPNVVLGSPLQVERTGNAQGNRNALAVAEDVVCLSDDD